MEVRVAKEAAIKARKEAEVHAAAAKTRPQNTSAKESVLQKEVDKCMVSSSYDLRRDAFFDHLSG